MNIDFAGDLLEKAYTEALEGVNFETFRGKSLEELRTLEAQFIDFRIMARDRRDTVRARHAGRFDREAFDRAARFESAAREAAQYAHIAITLNLELRKRGLG